MTSREAKRIETGDLTRRLAETTRALEEASRALARETGRREEVEASYRQSQRLEALGYLVGDVAHDFNNVLTALQGGLTMLDRHVGERGPKEKSAKGGGYWIFLRRET